MPCFPVLEDNQGAVRLSQNPGSISNSKHIDVRNVLRELVQQGDISVVHVPSEYQHADILTKALAFDLFAIHRRFLMNLNDRCVPDWVDQEVIYVCVYECVCFKMLTQTAGGLYQIETSESKDKGGLAEEVSNILFWGAKRSTTTRVTYWISYAPRVTVWGFQFGSMDHVFVVPIFGGTVSGYHARSSTIMSVISFALYANLSSTR